MPRVVYDDLVRDYLDSLNSKLRNFSVREEFLATWVHDEDPHVSIFEIFATAKGSGCRELTVAVGPAHARALDEQRVMASVSLLGTASLERGGDGGWEIHAAFSGPLPDAAPPPPEAHVPSPKPRAGPAPPAAAPKPFPSGELHPAYRRALELLSGSPRHEKPAPHPPPGGKVVASAEGPARLAVAVGGDGIVVAATHSGAEGPLRGLLDGLCDILQGRSFREGRDHAVIRLERRLRDSYVQAPVAGLVTPKNADPIFAIGEKLVRAAYRDWAAGSTPAADWNFWDDQPGPAWGGLSGEDRLSKAKAAVLNGCRRLSIPEDGFEVLEILNGCRIVLAATAQTTDPGFSPRMMELERGVKSELDPRLELQLESLEDRNRRAQRTARTDKLS